MLGVQANPLFLLCVMLKCAVVVFRLKEHSPRCRHVKNKKQTDKFPWIRLLVNSKKKEYIR